MIVPFDSAYDLAGEDHVMTSDGRLVSLDAGLQLRDQERRRRPGVKLGNVDLYDHLGWPVVRKGDNVGCSDGTDEKCQQALWFFRRQVSICGRIAAKYGQRCILLDTNCGPGGFVWEPDFGNRYSRLVIRGTPIQFLRALAKDPNVGRWTLGFMDLQQRHCNDLARRVQEWQSHAVTPQLDMEILCGDNEALAPAWVRQHFGLQEKPYGLVVHDANNGIDPILMDELGKLPQLEFVDFALYVPAAQYKWHKKELTKLLDPCRKSVWLLGPVHQHWQRLWMIGTRWKNCPSYEKRNFVRWDSDEGQERWDLITRTRAQRAA